MVKHHSYFSRPYAPAWGMLIGTAVGAPIGLATHASVVSVLALLGLLIGTVIFYQDKSSGEDKLQSGRHPRESRLRELDRLRSKSLISDKEYELKRQEILSDL